NWGAGGSGDYFVVKFDGDGAFQWARREAGGTGYVLGNGVATDSNGNVYVTGYFSGNATDFGNGSLTPVDTRDYFVVKFDGDGVFQWVQREASGSGNVTANGVATDSNGNVYVVGFFSTAA